MTCESTRGEWGKVCPDCGVRLPARQGPLASWMSRRHQERPPTTTKSDWNRITVLR